MDSYREGETWIEAFDALEEYVSEHLDIQVTSQSLAIPEPLRAVFYQKLSRTQALLGREVLGDSSAALFEVASLCGSVKRHLVETSDLVDFRLASAVEALVADPHEALVKPLFGLILDVLQKRSTRENLPAIARPALLEHSRQLFRNAYEAWAYYGIVAALRPTRFYEVFSPDTLKAYAISSGHITVGSQITSPERRIPEAVFETADGQLFAMKSEVARELDFYGTKITRRRDFSAGGNTIDLIAHRVLLLYRIPDINSIPIIADRDTQLILRSDLMCEVLYPQEMEQPSYVSRFVDRINTMRSKLPVQVICFDDTGRFPEGMLEDERVQAIEQRIVGFSEESLRDIAGLLSA